MTLAHPTANQILDAAKGFLQGEILPLVSDAAAFNLRVCIGAISLVQREIELGARLLSLQSEGLGELLQREGTVEELNDLLCERIASGALPLDDPGLAKFLKALTMLRVAIDQPGYSAYRNAAQSDAMSSEETS